MKRFLSTAALAASLALVLPPAPAPAQDADPVLLELAWMHVPPMHQTAFARAIEEVNAAARDARLPDEFEWDVWQSGSTFVVVFPVPAFASFDDPQYFMKHLEGKPAKERYLNAISAIGDAGVRPHRIEIIQLEPAWSYAGEPTLGPAHETTFWIAPGKDEAFDAIAKDWVDFATRLEIPYPVYGYRVRMGDVDRAFFISFHNDAALFYGEGSVDALATTKGMTSEWRDLVTRMRQVITRVEEREWMYVPDLSYGPAMASARR